MGCNSHLSIDFRGAWDDGRWEAFCVNVWEMRCYKIYALMAGVRNHDEVVPIAEPRGLPEDVSEESREFHQDHSDHSLTWLTAGEFREAMKRASPETTGRKKPDEWDALLAVLNALEGVYGIDNVRLIVGFDN